MELTLKPCPFCGGKAEFNTILTGYKYQTHSFDFVIHCVKCRATSPQTYKLVINLNSKGLVEFQEDERQAAVDDWNRRF